MSKSSKFNHTNLFAAFCTVLTGFFLFDAGLAAGHRWYASMTLDLILGGFFAGTLALIVKDRVQDAIRDGLGEMAEEAKEKLDEIFQHAVDSTRNSLGGALPVISHEAKMTDTLMHCIDEVTGGNRPPTPEDLAEIEKRFAAASGDHTVKLTLGQGGMEVEIKGPGVDVAKKAASVARKIEVKDPDADHERRSLAGKKAAATRKARLEAAEAAKVREARRAKRAATIAAKQK